MAGWQGTSRCCTCWRICSAAHSSYDGTNFSNFFTRYHRQARTIHGADSFKDSTSRSTTCTLFRVCCMTCGSMWFSFGCSTVSDLLATCRIHATGSGGCTGQHHGCSSTAGFTFAGLQTGNSHGLPCFRRHIWRSTLQHVRQFRWVHQAIRCSQTFYLTTLTNQDLRRGATT